MARAFTNAEIVDIDGMVKWVRHITPNQWGNWSITVYPNPAGLEKLREMQAEGMKNVLKKDEDGWYMRFNRPTQKTFGNKVQGFVPPEVFEKDGITKFEGKGIGNGTTATVRLETYLHKVPSSDKKARAARWLSLKVIDLVPFSKESFEPDELRAAKGLDERPEPVWN